MKLNKKVLAAALAFAFVAPTAQAASTTVYLPKEITAKLPEKVTYKGSTYEREQFEALLKDFNEKQNAYLEKKAVLDNAEEALKSTQERLDAAYKAYQGELDRLAEQAKNPEVKKSDAQKKFDRAVENINAVSKVSSLVQFNPENFDWVDSKTKDKVKLNAGGEANLKTLVDAGELQEGQISSALDQLLNDAVAYKKEVESGSNKDNKLGDLYKEYQTAVNERDRLIKIRDNAKTEYKKAETKRDDSYDDLVKSANAFGVFVKVENDGAVVVRIDDKKAVTPEVEKPAAKVTAADLQRQIDKSEAKLDVIEQMRKKNPKLYSHVEKELDALVVEQKANLKSAKALLEKLNKKAAFSLVSTAYASEEEVVTDEEIQAEIDKLKNTDEKIENLEAKQEEKVEEAKKDDDADDKGETDKSDDKKDGEKSDAKKEDDKKEETKVVEKKKVVTTTKKAGSNAKTGIAGVAGVAGVLAAASVAYAASKKN